jgi:hypothetical protein
MEKFFYECRPYFYIALSICTFLKLGDSKLAMGSGSALMFCGVFVLQMRTDYRRRIKTR